MRVQETREVCNGLAAVGGGKELAEIQKQAQGIVLRQSARRLAELLHEFAAIGRRREEGLQSSRCVIVESQVSRAELLFQDRHPGKQRQRFPLHAVRRTEQDFSFSLEESPGDSSTDVFRKGEGTVVEVEVEIRAVDRGPADVIDALLS